MTDIFKLFEKGNKKCPRCRHPTLNIVESLISNSRVLECDNCKARMDPRNYVKTAINSTDYTLPNEIYNEIMPLIVTYFEGGTA